jgi:hypothetical protein
LIPVVRKCWALRGVRPTVPYRTKYEWGYLYSALEVDGENAAEFLCLPEVSLEMSDLFLTHLAASDPDAEHRVIWDQAGFHPKPELHAVPEPVPLLPLPPYSPELNPTEAIGDVIKDRIGNELWEKLDDLEQAIGEELRPLCENAECVRKLVSHPGLVEQANATATENSAITCSKWYEACIWSGWDEIRFASGWRWCVESVWMRLKWCAGCFRWCFSLATKTPQLHCGGAVGEHWAKA